MPIFSSEYLRRSAASIFAAAGAPAERAELVAALLVESNEVGHDSHGIIRVPQYLGTIERGEIDPFAEIDIESETDASAVLNGNWGFGQVVMSRAAALGVEKAARCGLAALTVRNANHIGRLGSYVEQIARENMIGLLFANMHGGGVCVVPWGGREARLGTNPLAAGLPRPGGEPIVLDMTTSVVAEGKVRLQRNRGEDVPEGWIVDAEGRPSTDPAALYGPPRGGMLPFGGAVGYKGYGLSLVVEILGGALSAAGCAGTGSRNGNGVLLLVVDIERFVPMDAYGEEVDQFVSFLKSSPLAPGFSEILVPGEIESRTRQQRREGIEVDAQTWGQIVECGQRFGVELKAA